MRFPPHVNLLPYYRHSTCELLKHTMKGDRMWLVVGGEGKAGGATGKLIGSRKKNVMFHSEQAQRTYSWSVKLVSNGSTVLVLFDRTSSPTEMYI